MKPIKWIIGYIDWQGTVFAHVVREGDKIDSHGQVWPNKMAAHGKWRWRPTCPYTLDTYGENIDDDEMYRIFHRVERLCEVYCGR